jgi:hypothetical protein
MTGAAEHAHDLDAIGNDALEALASSLNVEQLMSGEPFPLNLMSRDFRTRGLSDWDHLMCSIPTTFDSSR